MPKRKAFNFYSSHWEQIKLLNKKQQLELLISICQVQFLEINIEDIEFKDNISTLVWTGIKHSIETSIKGFVSKQKGLGNIVDIPLSKPLGKGIQNPKQAPYQQGEEKGEEEEKEEEQPTNEFVRELEILNNVYDLFDFEIISSLTKNQKNDWLDVLNKLNRLDNYTYQEIEDTIIWGRNDDFWQSNFHSILGLRKKKKETGLSKFFQINKKMNYERLNGAKQSNKQAEDIRKIVENIANDPDLL